MVSQAFRWVHPGPRPFGPDSVLQLLDHVSYLHGKHAFKFGGEILVNQSTSNVTAQAKGPVQFHSLGDFFTGTAQSSPNTVLSNRKPITAPELRWLRRFPAG